MNETIKNVIFGKIVSYDKTLVDSEIVTIMDSVIDALSKRFDAKVRA